LEKVALRLRGGQFGPGYSGGQKKKAVKKSAVSVAGGGGKKPTNTLTCLRRKKQGKKEKGMLRVAKPAGKKGAGSGVSNGKQ